MLNVSFVVHDPKRKSRTSLNWAWGRRFINFVERFSNSMLICAQTPTE